ncbi:restriction endonuclease subunit S [Sporosarcina sp. PTS2304]|uniref:restriction endonuclease subunit S n=1 Tax=Sporosarcina sp. PTS2304 TaxID=2283194 RepID=UPI000E0D1EDD|nr:restriction endonuclease subunit S [Sporosarcina sp. PTS2304]AXH99844.1 restriction endonuclease subunit S [Sporosarcina sp. PTS2304]
MLSKNIPKLRFLGYDNKWERLKLGEVCDVFQSGKNIKSHDILDEGMYPVFGGNGLRGYTNTYNYEGLYAFIGRQGALCGNVNIFQGKSFFTEHAIVVKASKENDTKFLFYLLEKMNLRQYSDQSAQPGLAVNKLIKLFAFIPIYEEQVKIGMFFERLDETIALQQQELTILKQTKQGFLQKMFPKEGEAVPEVRFPGFLDNWKVYKLADITKLITKGTTPKDKYSKGDVNLIKVENIDSYSGVITLTSKVSKEEHEGYLKRSQLKADDILFSIAGTLGRTSIVKEGILPANTNQALAIIRLKNGNTGFVETYLKGRTVEEYIKRNPTVGAQPNLSLAQLGNLTIKLPSSQEQEAISKFFKGIDKVISISQQELEALQQTKKAFLQKMFV